MDSALRSGNRFSKHRGVVVLRAVNQEWFAHYTPTTATAQALSGVYCVFLTMPHCKKFKTILKLQKRWLNTFVTRQLSLF